MEFLKVWLLCIFAAVLYGILHDQITARVCVEYFTIGHPPVFNTTSPTLLALGWGVIATWWMGAFLGLILALAARLGSPPRLNASDLIKPVLGLLLVMAISALGAGVIGYFLARSGKVSLHDLDQVLGKPTAVRFIGDFYAHSASYAVGFFGGLFLCAWTLRKRWARRA
jgi:hypothetical protein